MTEVQSDYELFSEVFDAQPQAVVWLRPVKDEKQQIVDFEFAYCNDEGLRYLNLTREQQNGLLLSHSPTVTEELRKAFFDEMVRVYQTGEKAETNIYNPALNKYARVLRTRLRGGVLTIVQDRTADNRIIKDLEEKTRQIQEQTKFTDNILNASLHAIYVAAAIRNSKGDICDFSLTKVNKQYTRMFGYSEKDVVGKTMLTLFPNAQNTKSFLQLCRVVETGDAIEDEQYYSGEGINHWYHYTIVKLAAETVVVTLVDVTAQKEAVQQIEQQKTLLDNILRYSPAGISVTEVIRDEHGNVVDGFTMLANDPAIEYIGLSKEEILTKTVAETDPAILQSPLFQMALTTLQTGQPFSTQYFFEPGKRWLELSVAKLDNDHLINVFIDVTTTKEAQIHQQKLLEELQRSNTNLEEFAYAASHDLKEPIRKVLIFSDRLRSRLAERLDDEDKRLFSRLEAANLRMGALVDDLLVYSQVSHAPATFQEVDLNELMQLILDDLELEIDEKRASITIASLATIRGHRRQLQQLFQNLISNALKYTKPGVAPQINISCRTIIGQDTGLNLSPEEMFKTFYTIEVQDNGIGFEQEEADRIFNVFQRLHGRAEYAGSGVGLAIARKVAQNHGGYITATSAPGKGASFKVYLPVALKNNTAA